MRRPQSNTIGFRIRQARVEKGYNQKEFAQKLGIQAAWLSRLERNDGNASDELLLKIAQETGTSYNWITRQAIESTDGYISLEEVALLCIKTTNSLIHAYIDATQFQQDMFSNVDSSADLNIRQIFLSECPLSKWVLDISPIIYPELYKDVDWQKVFESFLTKIVLSSEERDTIKYTIVVPNKRLYDVLPSMLQVPIGVISVLQFDISEAKVVRERYFSTAPSRASLKFLKEVFCYPKEHSQNKSGL